MSKNLTILLAFLMTFGSQVNAFDPADLRKLKDTGDCSKCDLSNADLEGSFLLSADLWEANLEGANLKGAILIGAKIGYANLKGAKLSGADMRDASMQNVNLSGAELVGELR